MLALCPCFYQWNVASTLIEMNQGQDSTGQSCSCQSYLWFQGSQEQLHPQISLEVFNRAHSDAGWDVGILWSLATFSQYENNFSHSSSQRNTSKVSTVPETRSAALARSRCVLWRISDKPFAHESIESNQAENKFERFDLQEQPLASAALLPSNFLELVTSDSVARTAS